MPSHTTPCLISATIGHLRQFFVPSILAISFCGCVEQESATSPFTAEHLRHANRSLLEVAMEDAFSPPVAARVYTYPHIAHYLTLHAFHPQELEDLGRVLKDLDLRISVVEGADPRLSALLAFCKVAKAVVFTEQDMEDLALRFVAEAREADMDEETIAASDRMAATVADGMAPWMKADGYTHTRTLQRFTSTSRPGSWSETPPDYTAALEPHWQHIRPFIIESAAAYVVPPMYPYSTEIGSDFRKMVEVVHNTSLELSDSLEAIAYFWDDNPNISMHRGHLVTQEHRISPPGHWLNIIGQVTRRDSADLYTTTRAFTFSAVAMFDGLISCWHEKFRTDVIRPITYINQTMDPTWTSRIQTPPFPEYPSGHSVVSAAAAQVLDQVLGPDVPFVDSTEVIFGMGSREFRSYQDAAWEVSMSRFYGGIHYMESITEGNRQGRAIGDMVMAAVKP